MMDISSLTTPTTVKLAPQVEPAESKATSASATDYTMFLKMLTAQIQNQDPLNPIDSADYAVQLATFSGVEQQTKTNQLLESMGGQFGAQGLTQLAGWVGKDARTEGPVAFDGTTPVALSVTPRVGTDRAVLVATDANGAVVGRQDIPPGLADPVWQGLGTSGAALAPGNYSLSVETSLGGVAEKSAPASHYARITEVQSGANGNLVILTGGAVVKADEITALRGS